MIVMLTFISLLRYVIDSFAYSSRISVFPRRFVNSFHSENVSGRQKLYFVKLSFFISSVNHSL